jgi:neutral ceramidase
MEEGKLKSRRSFIKNSALLSAFTLANPILDLKDLPLNKGLQSFRISDQAAEGVLSAGFAENDITPEPGMEQPGGYGKSYHKSIHDPCKVRAMVIHDGKKRVAIVGIDAISIPRQLTDSVRKQVTEICGIAPGAILLAASHTHSGGPLDGTFPGEYDHADDLVKTLAYERSTAVDMKYYAHVEKQLVRSICEADKSRTEVRLGVGKGFESTIAFNRRFRMKNGVTYTHPRQGNPDILEVAGPIDPDVGVIGVWNREGKCIGCIVNYACHATCNPGGISANWIYYMEQTIRGAMGTDCIVVFLQGASGDVTQVDNMNPYLNLAGEASTRFVGAKIGAEAVKVLLSIPQGIMPPVDAKIKIIELERRKPDPERVKKCIEIVKKSPKEVGETEWIFAKEIVMLDALIKKEPKVLAEIQVIQIGPAVFVCNPAEFFCQLGLDIKEQSPFKYTFPVELANGCIGYVPTEEALGPGGGGYETRLTAYSNLIPQAGNIIVRKSVELILHFNQGAEPEFSKAPPFSGKPWDYGNVKPELR